MTAPAMASTDMQRFFWLLYEGHEGPHPPLHGRQLTLLFGGLDVDALEKSIASTFASHSALSARFELGDTGLEQSFGHPAPPLERTDLRAYPAHEREERAAAIVRRTFDERFDLAAGEAPFRVHLVLLADDEAVLARTVHHIAFDFRSSQILSSEIWAHYRAAVTGEPRPTPASSSDFADVLASEHALRTAADVDAKRAFWKEFLAGTSPPRRQQRPSPKTMEIELPNPVDAILDAEAREFETSRSGVVLARFARAIAAWRTGPQAVGYFTANRREARFASTVGCLAQWVPIRIEDRAEESARDASRRHDEAFKRALAHLLPIGEIGRSTGTPRLFDLMISLMLFPGLSEHDLAEGSRAKRLASTLAPEARALTEPFRIGALEVRELGTAMRAGASSLGLYIMPKRVSCEYDESVISGADARAMLASWAEPMKRRD